MDYFKGGPDPVIGAGRFWIKATCRRRGAIGVPSAVVTVRTDEPAADPFATWYQVAGGEWEPLASVWSGSDDDATL